MKKTNLTINDRANMTAQQTALRIESGENIDPREEVIIGDDCFESIFGELDSAVVSRNLGEHRVVLKPVDMVKDVVKSVQVTKNGVLTETSPYVRLSFIDVDTGVLIDLASAKEQDAGIHYTKRLYAGMVDGIRRNINAEYDGVAVALSTKMILKFLESHEISIWLSWNKDYGNIQADFFDRAAWEAKKAEEAKIAADARKSGNRRPTENKATR